jgi:hypothetical protein
MRAAEDLSSGGVGEVTRRRHVAVELPPPAEPAIPTARCRRVLIDGDPFREDGRKRVVWSRSNWRASWIGPTSDVAAPVFFACRRVLSLDAPLACRIHLSADERYALYVNGKLVGRGPERGDLANWFFESYDLELSPGEHRLVAFVWAAGRAAPWAQISAGPGFLLAAEGPASKLLDTGVADWECRPIPGIQFIDHPGISHDGYTGKKICVDGRQFPFHAVDGVGEGWSKALALAPAASGYPCELLSRRALRPAVLPPMLSRSVWGLRVRFAEWTKDTQHENRPCLAQANDPQLVASLQSLIDRGRDLLVPAHTRFRAVIDLDDYYCAFPHLRVSDGRNGRLSLRWAESLFLETRRFHDDKGNRDEIEGKHFRGFADHFILDGGRQRHYSTLWWQAGRYVQIECETHEHPLVLHELRLEETRYPLGSLEVPTTSDAAMNAAIRLAVRSLEVGLHETFTDSPYFEQLAYVGDVRLQALCLYTLKADDRPVRKAIELIGASRLPEGFTHSRYPARFTQVIAPYSLLWIGMVHDFARHRGDLRFVASQMPAVRSVLEAFTRYINEQGVLDHLPGWNFVDWSPGFVNGEPPCDADGLSCPINWQFVMALRWAAELESLLNQPGMSERWSALARSVAANIDRLFWDDATGAWAENTSRTRFSQHAQALGILSGLASSDRVSRAVETLVKPTEPFAAPTIYFLYYINEALRQTGHASAIRERLNVWRELPGRGLRCLPESGEPTRSDCHAWGAHVLVHLADPDVRSACGL